MNVNEMAEFLIDVVGLSDETLNIVVSINGYTVDTMEDILYAATGYRSFDQYDECE